MVAVVFVFADKILLIFGPDYAAGGDDALRLAALGVIPFTVRTLYTAVARIDGQGRKILVVQAAASILTLVLALALVGTLGVTGVALGWLIAEIGRGDRGGDRRRLAAPARGVADVRDVGVGQSAE